jgi:hypothetical protein
LEDTPGQLNPFSHELQAKVRLAIHSFDLKPLAIIFNYQLHVTTFAQ